MGENSSSIGGSATKGGITMSGKSQAKNKAQNSPE